MISTTLTIHMCNPPYPVFKFGFWTLDWVGCNFVTSPMHIGSCVEISRSQSFYINCNVVEKPTIHVSIIRQLYDIDFRDVDGI